VVSFSDRFSHPIPDSIIICIRTMKSQTHNCALLATGH
jgi:hypothetical protein